MEVFQVEMFVVVQLVTIYLQNETMGLTALVAFLEIPHQQLKVFTAGVEVFGERFNNCAQHRRSINTFIFGKFLKVGNIFEVRYKPNSIKVIVNLYSTVTKNRPDTGSGRVQPPRPHHLDEPHGVAHVRHQQAELVLY